MSTTLSPTQLRQGPSNELLGTLCFLAAEGMFFLGLAFVALKARTESVTWPPPDAADLNLAVPLANTLVLLVSSLTVHWAARAIRRDDRRGLKRWLGVTTLLGIVFLAGQIYEFIQLGGWSPGQGGYRALFDTLVALHGAHVLAGLGLLVVVLARALLGQFSAAHHMAVTATELYWHFVMAAWVVLLTVLLNFHEVAEAGQRFLQLLGSAAPGL